MTGRRPTRLAVLAVTVLVVTGCSGDDDPTGADRTTSAEVATGADATSAAADAASDAALEAADGTGEGTGPDDVGPAPEQATVTVSVRTGAVDGELSVPLDADDADPFGRFASCSGLRASVATYSVLVSDPDAVVRSVSVITDDAVAGPGVHDAEVRVEPASGAAIIGAGTVTLDPGLATGSYVAFDADGASVEGEFSCDGASGEPVPLEVGDDDGELDTVEVFALLRRSDEERVVGLTAAGSGPASLRCPGAGGPDDDGDVLVAVDGDSSTGAITAFEITAPPSPTMRMRVGSVDYEFDSPVIDTSRSATSGTFQAAGDDGISIDGAFRCT